MAGFEELLGIFTQQDNARESFARMNITQRHLNTSGICHGGFAATLAIAAARTCAGPTRRLISLDYRYLRPTPEGTLATARASILKRGSLLTAVEVRVHADEALVGLAFCEFAEGRVDTASTVAGAPGAAPTTPQISYTGDAARLAQASDDELMRMLGVLDRAFFDVPPAPSALTCAAMRTDARLAAGDDRDKSDGCGGGNRDARGASTVGGDENAEDTVNARGIVHPGAIALLADNTLGLAAFSAAGAWKSAVTTSLKLDCANPVPIGQELTCTAHLSMRAGQVLTLQSELWADGRQVGTCSGTFFALS